MKWDYDLSQFEEPSKRRNPIPFYGPTPSLSGFVVFVVIPESSRETKVTNLGLVSGSKEDIPSSQVTVNEPLLF
jgi:hypothetical protein